MPNVLMLMSDEHNPRFSGFNPDSGVKTPNLLKTAQRGSVFDTAYCPSPLCLPSRAAFMAGRRVHELQTYNNSNINLSPDFPSYGRILAEQGVYSVHISKVDVYADGEDLGFSEMILPRNREFPGDHEIDRNPVRTREGAARTAGRGPRTGGLLRIPWSRCAGKQLYGPQRLLEADCVSARTALSRSSFSF